MLKIMWRFLWTLCRQNIYFVIGVILGLGLSLLLTPIVDDDCFFSVHFNNEENKIITQRDDEYEPRINLAGKPQRAQKTPQTLIRPRYFSTELGIKDKLFIGVLTKANTLVNYAVALNKTVAHLVDKIMYFIDAPSAQRLNVSNLKLPGIVGFTDTREILKPFHLLKYITDNFLEEFDFFLLTKDTTYIRARELYEFVKKVSVSQDAYVGLPVSGQSEFCSLDAGILLSNSVLRKVQKTLDWCVKSAFSDTDSDNIGRCILHATKIPCQQIIQGQSFQSFHFENSEITTDDKEILKDQVFEKAITYFPIREPSGFYKLHLYLCKVAMMHKKLDIANLRHSLLNMSHLAPGGRKSVSWPIGNQPGNKPNNRFDVLRWDYFTETHLFLANDFTNVRTLSTAERSDVQYVLSKAVAHLEEKYEGAIQYRELVNGYRKFDPSRGMDYLLDLGFRDNTNGKEIYKRIEVCKPLGKVELLPIPYVTENTRVNLILPIRASDRKAAFTFIQQYSKVCMEKKDKTFLMLVFFYDPDAPGKGKSDDIYKDIKDTAISLSNRFHKDGSKIAWVSIKLPSIASKYTVVHEALLDFAAADLSIKKMVPESLVLICRTNMEIRQDYLNRVRMNTILQWQIFSPIPFVEMDPSIVYSPDFVQPVELDINKNYGHFDGFNSEHISFYAKDYWKARKAVEHIIPIVRNDKDILNLVKNEDLNVTNFAVHTIYSMFVRENDLHILRGVEPGLRLRHEEKICPTPPTISSVTAAGIYYNCRKSQAFNLGSRSQLAKLILEYQSSFTVS